MDRLILHLDMNAFFASVEQRANPYLRGKPILVGGSRAARTVVATASYEARQYGVETGMPMKQALRLCPHAIVVQGTPIKYIDTSERIFRMFLDYTPLVEIFSIDEAFLDVTSTVHFFGGTLPIAHQIKARIRNRFGLTCSIGIGPNKLIAKLASGMQKPDGLVEVTADRVPQILEDLPVDELCGIGDRLKEHLALMGIATCGELGRMTEEMLVERFGIIGSLLHRMGRGLDNSPVLLQEEITPAKSMSHCHTLEEDLYDLDRLKALLLFLSEKVASRLREDRACARTVHLTIRLPNFETHTHPTILSC